MTDNRCRVLDGDGDGDVLEILSMETLSIYTSIGLHKRIHALNDSIAVFLALKRWLSVLCMENTRRHTQILFSRIISYMTTALSFKVTISRLLNHVVNVGEQRKGEFVVDQDVLFAAVAAILFLIQKKTCRK
jgi:hypothetical protein